MGTLLTIVMIILAGIHVYWGHGGLWPGDDYQDLVDKVFGQGERFPSKIACYAVALCLLVASLFPHLDSFKWAAEYKAWACSFVSFVFAARGIGGLLPFVEKMWGQKFIMLNRRIYSPLCILLALGFLFSGMN